MGTQEAVVGVKKEGRCLWWTPLHFYIFSYRPRLSYGVDATSGWRSGSKAREKKDIGAGAQAGGSLRPRPLRGSQ